MQKVIAFNGSPRKHGNTSILINTVFEILQQEGIDTELIDLSGRKIRGCTACFKCFKSKNGQCAIKNDFVNECIKKMVDSDGIILASPAYFANVTTEMKALIDRAGLVAFANPGMLRHKVGASIAVARRTGASHVFQAMNTFFSCFEMFIVGSNYPNMSLGVNPGDVEKDDLGLDTMRTLGKNIAFLLKKLS